jgi:ribonuclease BN (tRNA processing enzyme)
MRLVTIGTGTAAPSAGRVSSGHLVEVGGIRILFDCGGGVVHGLAKAGADWMGITHLAITHFHPDHVSDLVPLFFAWRYGAIPWRTAPIELIGPPGTAQLVERMNAVYGGKLDTLEIPWSVREMEAGSSVELASGVRLSTVKVPHTDESVAYSITGGGRRLVYTGDTGPDEALGLWAAGCDILLTECSLPDEMRMDTHLTPTDCGELAAAANPGLLVLVHFYPPVEQVDIRAAVGARFNGAVALATDGWSTEIEEEE